MSRRADLLVVVPMKDPIQSKTRLAGALTAADRAGLARRLFRRTLDLLVRLQVTQEAPDFDLAVVTSSAEIAGICAARGVRVIEDGARPGLSAAVAQAARVAKAGGHRCMCVLPADLAVPEARDLCHLFGLLPDGPGAFLCPARDGGTNAMMLVPPDAIAPAYGPGSFHRHLARAEAAGLGPRILPLDSLKWDIDSSADLAAWQALGGRDGA